MRHLVAMFFAVVVLSCSARAADKEPISGQIGAVQGKDITIVLSAAELPAVGDLLEVFSEVAGSEPARIGVGKVTAVQGGVVTGVVEESTAALAFGQKVRILPAAHESRTAAVGLTLRAVDASTAELLELPSAAGAVVTIAAPGSAAEKAGLKKRDVIRAVDGAQVADMAAIEQALATAAGPAANLEIWREGAAQTIALELPQAAATPSNAPANGANAAAPATPAVWLGMVVANYRDDVRVESVLPDSPAARAGFHNGDRIKKLDGAAVIEHQEFVRTIAATPLGQKRRVEIERDGKPLTIHATPERKPTDAEWMANVKRLAEAGNHEAELAIAGWYANGQGDWERDPAEGVRWYQKAADAGIPAALSELGSFYINGQHVDKDLPRGVEMTRKAAEAEYVTAMRNMSILHREGTGVEKSEGKAREWHERALATGQLLALIDSGRYYESGTMYEKNPKKAAEYYHVAAKRGHPRAQYHYGRCLLGGIGVAEDRPEAARWFQKAADRDPWAQTALGDMYTDGRGIAQDHAQAVEWYRKAAAAQDELGMFKLGTSYDFGTGVREDDAEAAKWYRAAADIGNLGACVNLGYLYEMGAGVPQNDEQAVKFYRQAAEGGHVNGQFNLSNMYANGRGVEKDEKLAMEWCHKAALQKFDRAQHRMAEISYLGQGVAVNHATAFGWCKLAAAQGYAPAQNLLGYLHEKGEGTAVNRDEAIRWYQRAAAQNNPTAIENLQRLGLR